MRDLIEEVVSIRGELVEFFAIIYRENGIEPKAMLRARFRSDDSLLGYQTNPNIDMLKELVRQVSTKIARFYDYDIVVTTVSDLIDSRSYARLLREMQREQELHMRKREVAAYLN
jgi:hypothetical protein